MDGIEVRRRCHWQWNRGLQPLVAALGGATDPAEVSVRAPCARVGAQTARGGCRALASTADWARAPSRASLQPGLYCRLITFQLADNGPVTVHSSFCALGARRGLFTDRPGPLYGRRYLSGPMAHCSRTVASPMPSCQEGKIQYSSSRWLHGSITAAMAGKPLRTEASLGRATAAPRFSRREIDGSENRRHFLDLDWPCVIMQILI